MENTSSVNELTLVQDGVAVTTAIPSMMVAWKKPVELPQVTDADCKVTMKEWLLLDALAWDCYMSHSPGKVEIINDAAWSWSPCGSAGLGRGAGAVVASLVKKGLITQSGVGVDEASISFTKLGWVTWLTVRNRRINRGDVVRIG